MPSSKIQNILPKIKTNISLKNYTTFGIGGRAKYFFEAQTEEDIKKAIDAAKRLGLPFFIFGQGSNILFYDKDFKALFIKMAINGLEIKNYGKEKKIFLAKAGTPLSFLVEKARQLTLTGLEWATGIPGTIGGAVFGNAGAFGYCIGDMIRYVEVFDVQKMQTKKLSRKECCFNYKDSIFKRQNKYIILSVELVLKKGKKQEITKKMKDYLDKRKKSQPFLPSAGCIFKNIEVGKIKNKFKILKEFPEMKKFFQQGFLPAGYLIDKCGFKGRQIGQAKVSEKHANFIINLGEARAEDILKLIKLIKEKIKKKFNVDLDEEVRIIKTIDTKFWLTDNKIREAENKNQNFKKMPKKKTSRKKKTTRKRATRKKTTRKKSTKRTKRKKK